MTFTALLQRASGISELLNVQVSKKKGAEFNSNGSGGMSNGDYENPFFDYTRRYKSRQRETPAWAVEFRYRSEMSECPNEHLVFVEYEPSDLNIEIAKLLKHNLDGENTIVRLVEFDGQSKQ